MSYRKLFIASNVLLVVVFAWAFLKDFSAPWKPYQKAYYKMAAEELEKQAAAEKDPAKAESLRSQAKKMRRSPVEIKQIIAGDLKRFDRCITCHVGMDEYVNPTLKTPFKENPYKGHPQVDAALVKAHPFTKFGCTSCHSGQGLATEKEAAHGWVAHWEKPMLKGAHIQGSCVKCHGNFETLKGAEVARDGKRAFMKHGCQGCHSINGWGGVISVDLGDIADKPFERIAGYNFARVKYYDKEHPEGRELKHDHHNYEWNIQNWILGHLTNDPAHVTPNDPFAEFNAEPIPPSGMPNFSAASADGKLDKDKKPEISREDADAIVAFLSGLTKEEYIPYRYHVNGPGPAATPAAKSGKEVFSKYGCQGCHGLDAKEGRVRFNAAGNGQKEYEDGMAREEQLAQMRLGREPTLPDVSGTYSKEELIHKIAGGVPASEAKKWSPKGPAPMVFMPAWKDKISKHELEMLASWLMSIAKKDDSGF